MTKVARRRGAWAAHHGCEFAELISHGREDQIRVAPRKDLMQDGRTEVCEKLPTGKAGMWLCTTYIVKKDEVISIDLPLAGSKSLGSGSHQVDFGIGAACCPRFRPEHNVTVSSQERGGKKMLVAANGARFGFGSLEQMGDKPQSLPDDILDGDSLELIILDYEDTHLATPSPCREPSVAVGRCPFNPRTSESPRLLAARRAESTTHQPRSARGKGRQNCGINQGRRSITSPWG